MIRGTITAELARALRIGPWRTTFRDDGCQRCFGSIATPINRRELSGTSKLNRAYRGPSSPKVTWDNFEEDGAWENYIQSSINSPAQLEAKQRSEAKLLAAQEHLTQFPKQEPYTFWESYFVSEVKMLAHLERVGKFAANISALSSVLNTAPSKIRQEFSTDFQKLRTNQSALEEDVGTARLCRRIIENFVTVPLHAQAQAQQLRLVLEERREIFLTRVRISQQRQQESRQRAKEAAILRKKMNKELRKKQRDESKQQLRTEQETTRDPAATLGVEPKQGQGQGPARILNDELEEKQSLELAQSADHEAGRELSQGIAQTPGQDPEQTQYQQPEQGQCQEAEPSQSQAESKAAQALRTTDFGRVEQVAVAREQEQKNKVITIRMMEEMSNKYPERWAIEPLRTALKQAQTLQGGVRKIYRRRNLITRLTSGKKYSEVQDLIEKSGRNIGEMFALTTEWRALQYYKAHRYPGMLNERQVEHGKQIWKWVLRAHTKKEGDEIDDGN
jgi:hypothetical protein